MNAVLSVALAVFLGLMALPSSAWTAETTDSDSSLVGVWGCQSVYGGPFTGRSCRTWPWLTLKADGSYVWGSEHGRWEFNGKTLRLSGRTGAGHLNADGKLIVEYESKGTHYEQTLYKRP